MEENSNLGELYDLAALENEYRQYYAECKCGITLALARINNMKDQLDVLPDRNPIDYIDSRLKTFESVCRKCWRRGYVKEDEPLTMDIIRERVRDIAGIRVIVTFKDDIIRVKDEILRQPGIMLIGEKNYVENPKSNGYSSLHLNIQVDIYSSIEGISKAVPIEIQIRDLAQDLWAKMEHIAAYKNKNKSPRAGELFKKMSGTLDTFDMLAIELRDYQPGSDEEGIIEEDDTD